MTDFQKELLRLAHLLVLELEREDRNMRLVDELMDELVAIWENY